MLNILFAITKFTLADSIFYFCGPSKMRNQLRRKLVNGWTKSIAILNLKLLKFETGIGIRRGIDLFREQIKQEITDQPDTFKCYQKVASHPLRRLRLTPTPTTFIRSFSMWLFVQALATSARSFKNGIHLYLETSHCVYKMLLKFRFQCGF